MRWSPLALLVVIAACSSREPPAADPPVRQPPPPAQRVETLDRVDQASLVAHVRGQGASVTVVAAWATWCQPCIAELAELAQYHDEHAERGLGVVGLCLDDPERMGRQIQQVLDRLRVPYDMVVATPGQADRLMRGLAPAWNGTLPASLLFGEDGALPAFVPDRLTAATLAARVTPRLRPRRAP